MKQITQLNQARCPQAFVAISERIREAQAVGREVAVFRGLAYIATADGIWHVALRDTGFDGSPVEAYENDWTDADFGLPAARKLTARQIEGAKRTGYNIGDAVDIMAGSSSPMASGVVCGYGAAKLNPLHVRIRLSKRRVETWPISLIRKSA